MTPFCPDHFVSGILVGLCVVPIACLITAAVVSHFMHKKVEAERVRRSEYLETTRDQARKERDQWLAEAFRFKKIIANATEALGAA